MKEKTKTPKSEKKEPSKKKPAIRTSDDSGGRASPTAEKVKKEKKASEEGRLRPKSTKASDISSTSQKDITSKAKSKKVGDEKTRRDVRDTKKKKGDRSEPVDSKADKLKLKDKGKTAKDRSNSRRGKRKDEEEEQEEEEAEATPVVESEEELKRKAHRNVIARFYEAEEKRRVALEGEKTKRAEEELAQIEKAKKRSASLQKWMSKKREGVLSDSSGHTLDYEDAPLLSEPLNRTIMTCGAVIESQAGSPPNLIMVLSLLVDEDEYGMGVMQEVWRSEAEPAPFGRVCFSKKPSFDWSGQPVRAELLDASSNLVIGYAPFDLIPLANRGAVKMAMRTPLNGPSRKGYFAFDVKFNGNRSKMDRMPLTDGPVYKSYPKYSVAALIAQPLSISSLKSPENPIRQSTSSYSNMHKKKTQVLGGIATSLSWLQPAEPDSMASPLGLSRATQLQAESAHDYYSVGYNSTSAPNSPAMTPHDLSARWASSQPDLENVVLPPIVRGGASFFSDQCSNKMTKNESYRQRRLAEEREALEKSEKARCDELRRQQKFQRHSQEVRNRLQNMRAERLRELTALTEPQTEVL